MRALISTVFPRAWDEAELRRRYPHWDGRELRRRRRFALELIGVCVVGLVPWTIYLALSLPDRYRAEHWNVAWAGFDVMLLLAMAATVVLGWRRHPAVLVAVAASATMLVCDAWFDITLDAGTSEVWESVASAVFVELPLAAFFLHRARLIARLILAGFFAPTRLPAGETVAQTADAAADATLRADGAEPIPAPRAADVDTAPDVGAAAGAEQPGLVASALDRVLPTPELPAEA